MKLKSYDIYHSGSTFHSSLRSTCITKAIKQFIQDNNLIATYNIRCLQEGAITLKDNHTICSDYIITERN